MKKIAKIIIIVLVFSFISIISNNAPVNAAGSFFYLTPSTGTKVLDSNFSVSVKVNTSDANINAAEATLNFDTAKIQVVSIDKNGSIFNLWTTNPAFDNTRGTISFGGGIPQPGYTGKSGNVINITFKAKMVGEAQVFFSSGAILANDGLGTNILTSMGSANYLISPKNEAPKEEPEEERQTSIQEAEREVDTQSTVNTQLANELGIMSSTHPDQNAWYGQNNVEFKWNLSADTEEVSYVFDQSPETNPTAEEQGLIMTKKFENVADGVWYFHLKSKNQSGWSEVSHYRIQIDTTPPAPFKISVDQQEASDLPILFFKTVDAISGIVRYEVNIGSLEEKAFIVNPEEDALKVPSLEIGPHTAMVKAIDKAGNEVISTIDFNVTPIESPVIKNYSQELQPNDQFFMSGTALGDLSLIIYFQKDDGKIVSKRTTSDKNGLWYFINDGNLENGRYVAWVEAVNDNGLKSEPTPKISFLVTPPVFARVGSLVINYFTIFASLLFFVLMIIIAAVYLAGMIRKKLKKETFEVEDVLHDNIETLKDLVDEELTRLSRLQTKEAIKKEKTRLKTELKKQIEMTEKKIMKEIKDVENILK